MLRGLDLVLALLALLVVWPLLLGLMLALRLTGEGEVFYRQARVGRGGKTFYIYKFATMLKDSPNLGTGTVTLKDDPRVLPLGKFLRRTKLNELPQILNILNGTMSLVGPRPQTQRCFDAFPLRSQEAIKQLRPGLTGVGSLVFSNEEDLLQSSHEADRVYDEIIMPYKGRLEEWYAAHQGVRLYVKLLALTARVMSTGNLEAVWRALPGIPQPGPELAAMLERRA